MRESNGIIPTGWESMGVQLGLTVAFWISVGMLLITLVCAVVWFIRYRNGEGEVWGGAAIVVGVLTLIPVGLAIWLAIPMREVYWQDYRVQGEVLDVSNVLVEDGGDLTRTPVVTLDGVDRPIVVDDPRVVKLAGQTIELRCSIDWHYRAQDTYACELLDTTTGGSNG